MKLWNRKNKTEGLLEQIRSTLQRINMQNGILIEQGIRQLDVWGAEKTDPEDALLSNVVETDGELKDFEEVFADDMEPEEPTSRSSREPAPAGAAPRAEYVSVLWQPLKSDHNKSLGWSVIELLNKNSRSMESLMSTYPAWTQSEILEALNTLIDMGLMKSHVRRTRVNGVSAVRRIYRGTGQSWDEYHSNSQSEKLSS